MSRRRGLHKPDPARSAYRVGAHTNPRIAAVLAAGLPLSYSLSQYWRTAFNQGNSDKCHSHSASTSIAVAFASAGKKLPFDGPPSPENIAATTYANMRRASWNGISDLPKLLDTGASLEDDVGAVGQWGAGPMGALVGGRYSDSPDDTAGTFTPEPDERALVVSGKELIVGAYSVPLDAAAARLCAASLVAGIPVQVGGPVGNGYEYGDPTVACPAEPDGDGHATVLLDFRTNPATGELEFWDATSWGNEFGVASPVGSPGGRWVGVAWLRSMWQAFPWNVAGAAS